MSSVQSSQVGMARLGSPRRPHGFPAIEHDHAGQRGQASSEPGVGGRFPGILLMAAQPPDQEEVRPFTKDLVGPRRRPPTDTQRVSGWYLPACMKALLPTKPETATWARRSPLLPRSAGSWAHRTTRSTPSPRHGYSAFRLGSLSPDHMRADHWQPFPFRRHPSTANNLKIPGTPFNS